MDDLCLSSYLYHFLQMMNNPKLGFGVKVDFTTFYISSFVIYCFLLCVNRYWGYTCAINSAK